MTTTAIPDNPGELTTYIETHYHARHREVLPIWRLLPPRWSRFTPMRRMSLRDWPMCCAE